MELPEKTSMLLSKYDRYNHSEKGLARNRRYDCSEKARIKRERFYAKHSGKRAYQMGRYYELQGEIGYRGNPYKVLPGYRFLKALETAEIVEA